MLDYHVLSHNISIDQLLEVMDVLTHSWMCETLLWEWPKTANTNKKRLQQGEQTDDLNFSTYLIFAQVATKKKKHTQLSESVSQ